MLVLLDNGHGVNTPGKASPDGSLKEYKYTREIVSGIQKQLTKEGIDSKILVPEDTDIPLKERVSRVNKLYENNKDVILISVHCNAAGADGQWHNARGWSVFISQNSSENSKKLANSIAKEAELIGLKMRYSSPGQAYWVQSLAMCRDTKCPSVLTENLFQDNEEDVKFLLSEEGKDAIINLHVNGIKRYLSK